jgi:hypothetical protein
MWRMVMHHATFLRKSKAVIAIQSPRARRPPHPGPLEAPTGGIDGGNRNQQRTGEAAGATESDHSGRRGSPISDFDVVGFAEAATWREEATATHGGKERGGPFAGVPLG